MARQDYERWLEIRQADDEEQDTRRRLWSLWLDMEQVIQQEIGDISYGWKLAALVVWHALPRRKRQPRHEYELAELLDTSDRVLRKWRVRHAEFFAGGVGQRAFAGLVRDVLPDVLDAAVRCAVEDGAQGHQDRKMLLEMGNLYKAKAQTMLASGVQVYLPDNQRG